MAEKSIFRAAIMQNEGWFSKSFLAFLIPDKVVNHFAKFEMKSFLVARLLSTENWVKSLKNREEWMKSQFLSCHFEK